jgi:hypothetical protein
MVFVVDVSQSVADTEWAQSVEFTKALVDSMPVSPDQVRLPIVHWHVSRSSSAQGLRSLADTGAALAVAVTSASA